MALPAIRLFNQSQGLFSPFLAPTHTQTTSKGVPLTTTQLLYVVISDFENPSRVWEFLGGVLYFTSSRKDEKLVNITNPLNRGEDLDDLAGSDR